MDRMMDNTMERIEKNLATVKTIPGVKVDLERRIVVVPMLHTGRNCVQFLMQNGFTILRS